MQLLKAICIYRQKPIECYFYYRTVETEFKFAPLLSCEGAQTKFLFIGGHHSPSFIPAQMKNRRNFEGCLQQVYFKVYHFL